MIHFWDICVEFWNEQKILHSDVKDFFVYTHVLAVSLGLLWMIRWRIYHSHLGYSAAKIKSTYR